MTAVTLEIRHVTKRFGDGATEVTAVRNVSLVVEPGEVVLIMGPSGSGKTTLLSMMGALLRPTEGSINLDGQAISELSEGRLPDIRLRQFGFIFQDFNLLSALTALENVAIVAELAGLRGRAAREKAGAALTELGLGARLDFLPEKLSGGEKQRVAIARALVNDPALILADEPTANLDSKIGHEIMRLLRKIAKEQGRSVVVVSHDQRIRDIADRVLWLEDGAFRDMVTMATDPVCGMAVERDRAVSAEQGGHVHFFCSRGCRAEYLGNLDPIVVHEQTQRGRSEALESAHLRRPHGETCTREENSMFETGTSVVDPVCGMTIDRDDAIQADHEEATYFFCDPACASIFKDEPSRWLDGAGRGTFAHEH